MKRMALPGTGDKTTGHFIYMICAMMLISGCGGNKEAQVKTPEPVQQPLNIPSFNPDSAFIYTKVQVDFGPRIPNSKSHVLCGDYLVAQLKQWCDTVIEQRTTITAYDGRALQMRNIIGSVNPQNANRIILAAHWDTRPWADQDTKDKEKPIDGANDGAASAAILLEVARQLHTSGSKAGVDIILFDLEDYGKSEYENSYCYGSQYWAANKHIPGYQARFGILLDMVAASNIVFTKEGTSLQFARDVVDKVWGIAANAGYGNYFVQDESAGIIDDHYYVNRIGGIKCIDIVSYDYSAPSHFWKHWHTHEDTIDKIDKTSLKAVGQVLLEVLYRSEN
jgi:hypothetical protein